MMSPDAGSRLCAQCGLCCNGVLFHRVLLQPGDSARELAALGLKLKRKRSQNFFLQPCPAYRDAHCSIYASRPGRCRAFECRQLKGVIAGEITESQALGRIREARQRVEKVNSFLQQAGELRVHKPLSKRCENVISEPLGPGSTEETSALRTSLALAAQELEIFLDHEFRLSTDDE